MPAPVAPDLSVIIPTFNRSDSLRRTLESLVLQTLPVERFEVVVVDDGGSDDTESATRSTHPLSIKYEYQENQGSAVARNRGVCLSAGSVLIFIDDDMTLDSAYLAAVVNRAAAGTIAMGVWQPYEPPGQNPFNRAVAMRLGTQAAYKVGDQEVSFVECASNNLAVLRADFLRVGMWQDVLGDGPTLWGDVEFGYRAWKMGFRFVRVAGAKLIHRDQHMSTLASATKRAYHVSRIVQPLFALHPEIREHIPMFLDKGPIAWRQDPPALILRKLARQGASSNLATATMEKVVPMLERRAPSSRALRLLYRWIVSGYIHRGYREGLRGARMKPQLSE